MRKVYFAVLREFFFKLSIVDQNKKISNSKRIKLKDKKDKKDKKKSHEEKTRALLFKLMGKGD